MGLLFDICYGNLYWRGDYQGGTGNSGIYIAVLLSGTVLVLHISLLYSLHKFATKKFCWCRSMKNRPVKINQLKLSVDIKFL